MQTIIFEEGVAPFLPMEAALELDLPRGDSWQYEPKWDGFRCLAVKRGNSVQLFAKSGKPLTRFFPEMVEAVGQLNGDFIIDGELVIPLGDNLDFDALQMRLHPAESRIRKLAHETPARYVVFDMLQTPAGENLLDRPLTDRRAALEAFLAKAVTDLPIRLSPFTLDWAKAESWLNHSGGALDGVVAKRQGGSYQPGERAMVKVKLVRTADCVVGGFRYGTDSSLVGSLLLGLFNAEGRLDHVGFTSGIAESERPEITRRVEALKGGPGFTGNAPGGPSRWSTERSAEWVPLKLELVVEVTYDQVTGNRFRHGTRLVRWRPDKAPEQCTLDQLKRERRPSELSGELF